MEQEKFEQLLKEVRQSPRKMHNDFLKKVGILDKINELVPFDNFKLKEKIDVILDGQYLKCYCGNLLKVGNKYCSNKCNNDSPETRRIISEKQTNNAKYRMEKTKKTVRERYNVDHVQQIQAVSDKTREKKLVYYEKWRKETFDSRNLDYEKLSDPEYLQKIVKETSAHRLAKLYFGDMPVTTMLRHIYRVAPNIEFPKTASGGEKEVADFVESLGFNIIRNDRTVITPLELDIFVPSMKLAIEYNGLYFHRDDKKKHLNKFNLCEQKGIQLIQIFEDEWLEKSEIVKSIIRSKLHKELISYFARNLSFGIVDRTTAKAFLEANHLQGFINGQHYGLFDPVDGLVSIITVGKSRFSKESNYELFRYASKLNSKVSGGFTKLITNYKKISGNANLLTYADLRYSNGKTYEKFGRFISQSEPGYFWMPKSFMIRIKRYETQKHKLKDFLGESFNPNLSENDNMVLAGYTKIWDCGNRVYII